MFSEDFFKLIKSKCCKLKSTCHNVKNNNILSRTHRIDGFGARAIEDWG